MIIEPDWNIFKAKFSKNPQDTFEWFCYLLFCREHNLDKGWFGFHNQSGIEYDPVPVEKEIIGFQAKFYDVPLSKKKNEFLQCIKTTHKNYPNITKIIFYLSKKFGEAKGGKPKYQLEVEKLAHSLGIDVIWRTPAYFESDFVVSKNNDLARYFFTSDDYQGWERYKDWSSTQTNIESEYFVDENIKIITPNHNQDNNSDVINGINAIRTKLQTPKTSVRLVGLSGVGKTRLAQALFDKRIGENPLDVRSVWYCDFGTAPKPIPLHFINQLKQKNERYIVIVDNCGQALHSNLTKAISNDDNLISLLTIEYDVSDDLPENTNVFKLEPNSKEIIEKVIKRHYPNISSSAQTISELTGGNYRLALAIASNINRTDNIAVLNDNELFKRLFYQNGSINDQHYEIAQVCSIVFSFNINDTKIADSEINFLSELADLKPKTLKKAINFLQNKDIVQKRGDYRAILPHVLANHLSKQYLKQIDEDDLEDMFAKMPSRLQRSLIKRLSYLHDEQTVKTFVKNLFEKNSYLGKKLISDSLSEEELKYIELLSHIQPKVLLDLIEHKSNIDSGFLSRRNPHHQKIARIIKNLSFEGSDFEQAFWLLLKIVKTDKGYHKNDVVLEMMSCMFRFYTSETLATFDTKKKVLEELFNTHENEILFYILKVALQLGAGGVIYQNTDIGRKLPYGYHAQTYPEIWDWTDFLLSMSYKLEKQGFKLRSIIVNCLDRMICECSNLQVISQNILLFHNSKPFSEALHKLNDFINYRREELETNAPKLLQEIKNLINQLEPNPNNLEQLLLNYVLIDESALYRYTETDLDDPHFLNVPNFDSYDSFIEHISVQLKTDTNFIHYLPKLVECKNSLMKKIGYEVYERYSSSDEFLADLSILNIDEVRYSFFLMGCFKKIKEKSFDDYKKSVLALLKTQKYQNLIPNITMELCNSDKDINFMCNILDMDLDIDFYAYYLISCKRNRKEVTDNNFDQLISSLIKNRCTTALNQICKMEAHYGGQLEDKYAPLFLQSILSIYTDEAEFYFKECLTFLLSNSNSINDVFKIFKGHLQHEKYISLSRDNKEFTLLSNLIQADTYKFIDEFIENSFLNERVIIVGSLNRVLYHADSKKVIKWMANDQEKIEYWAKNSRFTNIDRMFDELNDVVWNDLLIYLLKKSNKPETIIDLVFDNSITHISGWSGNLSDVMKKRTPLINSLVELFNNNDLQQYIAYLEKKKKKWNKNILLEKHKEAQENEQNQSFDY